MGCCFDVETNVYINDEKVLISSAHKEWHYEVLQVEEYYAPVSLLTSIEEAFYQYGVQKFSNLPETNEIVFDAASRDYSFTFKDLKNIRFGSSKKIPTKGF